MRSTPRSKHCASISHGTKSHIRVAQYFFSVIVDLEVKFEMKTTQLN